MYNATKVVSCLGGAEIQNKILIDWFTNETKEFRV